MNKKFKSYVPICFVAAIMLFIAIVFLVVNQQFRDFSEQKERLNRNNITKQSLETQIKQFESEQEAERMKLRSLKPIYETTVDSSNDSLGIFGNMFEDIIKKAQSNGLLIRSIEYSMHPETDPIYSENSEYYNACELKFFFVGKYSQLQAFLADMNNNFKYLTYISGLNVTAFSSNTDYLLINMSITLYSKKPVKKAS